MNMIIRGDGSALFGPSGQIGVARALGEFHAGRPVLVTGGDETILALPAEGLGDQRLNEFVRLCAPAAPRLIITARRALALGLEASTPVAVHVGGSADAETILAIVADAKRHRFSGTEPARPAAKAAIQLAKLAQGLPAVLVADAARAIASTHDIIGVEADSIARFGADIIQSLTVASRAEVPLKLGKRATFVVFRDGIGGSPAAIIIGKPDFNKPVLVRLHSACLTGDVFGSRRCDCGDQLQLALNHLEEQGGGIVLYLAQEGRGLGLANKMRTYQMQDDGLDTIDANTTLGFDEDERDYGIAARMLQMLGCNRVVLLTNNPAKIEGLAKSGIEIAGRMPIEAPINLDNRRYLATKASRAGHRLNYIASLSETSEPPRI
ncbi:MAG: cyclohydrolase [Methylobacteriaceae bacterium]|jgi:GTP cyclohydrolase II|nr:cyclohydrolase [Methylobacteriaceae bacterium]